MTVQDRVPRLHVDSSRIPANESESNLSIDAICRNFKVSRSTPYRLFEPLGGVSHYVKERRLARVHACVVATSALHSSAPFASNCLIARWVEGFALIIAIVATDSWPYSHQAEAGLASPASAIRPSNQRIIHSSP